MTTAVGTADGKALKRSASGSALTAWQNALAIATAVVPAGKVPISAVIAVKSAAMLQARLMSFTTVWPLGVSVTVPLGETLAQPPVASNAMTAKPGMNLLMR